MTTLLPILKHCMPTLAAKQWQSACSTTRARLTGTWWLSKQTSYALWPTWITVKRIRFMPLSTAYHTSTLCPSHTAPTCHAHLFISLNTCLNNWHFCFALLLLRPQPSKLRRRQSLQWPLFPSNLLRNSSLVWPCLTNAFLTCCSSSCLHPEHGTSLAASRRGSYRPVLAWPLHQAFWGRKEALQLPW